MAKILRNEAVLAKVEATAGVAETTAGTDYVRVMEPAMALEGNRVIERSGIAGGAQGAFKSLHGGTLRNLTFGWEVAAGTNSSPIPEHNALYQGVGFVVDSATDPTEAVYTLQSDVDAMKALTLAYYQDGTLRQMFGARASAFSIDATAGATLRCDATFIGKAGTDSDTATPTLTQSDTPPLVVKNVTLTVGGSTTFVVDGVQIDMGLDTQMLGDMSQSDGYAIPRIVNRAVSVTINPEKGNLSVRNWFANLTGETNVAISFEVGTSFQTESTGRGRVRVNLPNCVITELSDGDRGGIRTDEISLMAFRGDAGNDELTFRFD